MNANEEIGNIIVLTTMSVIYFAIGRLIGIRAEIAFIAANFGIWFIRITEKMK